MAMTVTNANNAIALAREMRDAGADYALGEVSHGATDCTGMVAIMYNTCNGATGGDRFRWRFWTGSPAGVFDDLGFTRLLGPAGSFQIGYSTAAELGEDFGHAGCTVMGVNIEMSASNLLRVGGGARGANNPLFKHQRHIPIPGAVAALGAFAPVAATYPGHVIKRGSTDREAVRWVQGRLRWFGNQIMVDGDFGARTEELVKKFQANRRADAPGADKSGEVGPITWAMLAAPKFSHILVNGNICEHVKQIKVALNRLGNHLDATNGRFGDDTEAVVKKWQDNRGQTVTGKVNRLTWSWMHVPLGHHPTPDLSG